MIEQTNEDMPENAAHWAATIAMCAKASNIKFMLGGKSKEQMAAAVFRVIESFGEISDRENQIALGAVSIVHLLGFPGEDK